MASPYRAVIASSMSADSRVLNAIISVANRYAGKDPVLRQAAALRTQQALARRFLIGSKFLVLLKSGSPIGFMEFAVEEATSRFPRRVQIFHNLSVTGENPADMNNRMKENVMRWARQNNILVVHDTIDTDHERKALEKYGSKKVGKAPPKKGTVPLVAHIEEGRRGNVQYFLNPPKNPRTSASRRRGRPPAQ